MKNTKLKRKTIIASPEFVQSIKIAIEDKKERHKVFQNKIVGAMRELQNTGIATIPIEDDPIR